MATVLLDIRIEADAETVWEALRDFDAVHERVALGFVVGCVAEPGARRVTFSNGLVAIERLVSLDDRARRLAYAIQGGRPSHHNASFEVRAQADGCSRVLWRSDFLPDDLLPAIGGMMEEGAEAMRRTLGAAHTG